MARAARTLPPLPVPESTTRGLGPTGRLRPQSDIFRSGEFEKQIGSSADGSSDSVEWIHVHLAIGGRLVGYEERVRAARLGSDSLLGRCSQGIADLLESLYALRAPAARPEHMDAFEPDAALGRYVANLYGWCETLLDDLDGLLSKSENGHEQDGVGISEKCLAEYASLYVLGCLEPVFCEVRSEVPSKLLAVAEKVHTQVVLLNWQVQSLSRGG